MLKLRKTPIEEGVTARGEKRKFYYSPHPWFLLILLLTLVIPSLPFGLIGALMFITFFSFIDGFQVSQGLKWDYSLDKLIPVGIFLSAGFLSALVNRKPDHFRSCNDVLPYFCNPCDLLVFYTI